MGTIMDKLETKTNEYMSYLFPGVTIKYDIVIGEGNKRNRFIINVKDENAKVYRNYIQWSGGEKKRISVSIILALNWLVGVINQSNGIDFLFLDEIFGGLDSIGRECVMDAVTSGDKKVFIITHIDELERMRKDNVITVSKSRGVSRVV